MIKVTKHEAGKPVWPKWKDWDYCSKEEQHAVNMRTLWPSEIVLDIESMNYKHIERKLMKYDYRLWRSGGRGVHFHLTFPEMENYSQAMRTAIRKAFLKQFPGADQGKASENVMIQIEGKPHHRSGKTKTLLYDHSFTDGSIASLPSSIIRKAKETMAREYSPARIVSSDFAANDPLLKFVLTHRIPDGLNRNSVLFKNLAIGLVQSGLSDAELRPIIKNIIANCPGKSEAELQGWVRWARQEPREYNKRELNAWIHKANEVIGDD